MERIGFIGLGVMGKPMARNLLKAGYSLTVHNRSPQSQSELVAEGAVGASSGREVAKHSDVVITMLPDSPDVEAVYMGSDGVLSGSKRGMTLIDMSTISPAVSRGLAAQVAQLGVPMLDAPVSGGEVGAINGTLSIMVGGDEDAFNRCLPLLRAMGKNVVLVGDSGAGQVCKACNQIVVGLTIEAVSEALVLAKKAGVDPAKVRQALMGGFAQSRILELHGQRMLDRSFDPGFRLRLHLKDMNIVLAAGKDYGASLPISSLVAELMKAVVANGHAEEDHSALVKALELLSATRI